jgi:hypothetical protein
MPLAAVNNANLMKHITPLTDQKGKKTNKNKNTATQAKKCMIHQQTMLFHLTTLQHQLKKLGNNQN